MLSGIWDLECRCVKKLNQCHLTLFIGAQKSAKLAGSWCKNGWEKHYRAFLEVVEGNEMYNFGIHCLEHFSCKILRNQQSNRVTLKWFAREHEHARDVTPSHVGLPPYSPYTNAEAGLRPLVRALIPSSGSIHLWAPWTVLCVACALATQRHPRAAIGRGHPHVTHRPCATPRPHCDPL
jgi:hypothetical protein